MCYISLGHYELAAADASRAALATHALLSGKLSAENPRQRDLDAYLRAENLSVLASEPWTTGSARFVGPGWAASPLASLVINDTPEVAQEEIRPQATKIINLKKFDINQQPEMYSALEVRAVYRLVGALSLCGGGARADALELLDDAIVNLDIMEWERFYLMDLGNEIMDNVFNEIDGSERVTAFSVSNPVWANMASDERSKVLRDLMKQREVNVHWIDAYSEWNKYKFNLADARSRQSLEQWANADLLKCRLKMSERGVTVVASRDIRAREPVLAQKSAYNVNTSQSQSPSEEEFYYEFCTCCASLVILPKGIDLQRISDLVDESKQLGQIADNFPEFTQCPWKHRAPLCSLGCAFKHKCPASKADVLCDTDIEQTTLAETLNNHADLPCRSLEQREQQALRDLMLLRVLAVAFDKELHPLCTPEIAVASSLVGSSGESDASGEFRPKVSYIWSFTNNIVKPIQLIRRLRRFDKLDPFHDLGQVDGWDLNVLVETIKNSMETGPSFPLADGSPLAHFTKLIDETGNLKMTILPEESNEARLPKQGNLLERANKIRVGRLNPIKVMIRVADSSKGEVPNVKLEQRTRLIGYALGDHESTDVIIREGEELLRVG